MSVLAIILITVAGILILSVIMYLIAIRSTEKTYKRQSKQKPLQKKTYTNQYVSNLSNTDATSMINDVHTAEHTSGENVFQGSGSGDGGGAGASGSWESHDSGSYDAGDSSTSDNSSTND